MSLESQFKSKVLLEKIEPLTVIKNEPEIGIDQDIISAYIKDEIDIEYNIISEDLIKNEPNPNNLLKSEHLESVETQIFIQTENTPFIKNEFENLVKTENTSDEKLSVVSGSTHKKRKAKMDNCRLKYHCNKCKYKTLRRRNLEKHKVIHLKPNKIQYLCYHCSYKSNQKGNLKTHIFGHFNREEVPFHCYICNFVTSKRNLIIKHFKKHPEHRRKWDETEYKNQHFRCDQCKYKTLRKRNLEIHKLIHLKPDEIQWFYCYHCSYKTKQKRYLKVHILGHFKREEVPFHCYICDFVTKKRDLIIEHFKKHPEHISKCDETDYKKRYCCKKCPFRTFQYEKFNLHELTHKTEVEMDDRYLKYQCDKCTYKTSRKSYLNTHKLNHLKPEEIPWFYCYHCSYKAKQKVTLKRHILGHFTNEVVTFHCYICDFVTKKRHLIFEHFKKHPEHISKCDETDYKKRCNNCKKCAFRTFQYEKFNLHELTHKTEVEMDDRYLKYQCDKCTYKTFTKGSFKKHKLIHLKPEEIQWFYCYHCSYKAKHMSNLKDHILIHFKNEEVPFHCYICDFVTRKRYLIIEHFKKHPEHVSKCDETDYEIHLKLTPNIKRRYCCKKCAFRTYQYEKFNLHELTHKTEVEMDDRYLKYQCDKCTYKTFRKHSFKIHKLIHLKPDEIQWFYCYHCSYKTKQKRYLKVHILGHFKREVVKFHCYMCNFMTLKRKSITEHIKTHSKVKVKCEINQRL